MTRTSTGTLAACLDAAQREADQNAKASRMSTLWDEMADHALHGGPEYERARDAFNAEMTQSSPKMPALHFIGFRGDEYFRACRFWGSPDFVHRNWDVRARQEVINDDVAVFAKGDDATSPRPQSFNDSEHM